MIQIRRFLLVLAVFVTAVGCSDGSTVEDSALPATTDLLLATTTSTQDSGLLDVLLPIFEEETGYRVKTLAVGTGEALAMGMRGDVDVVLAHAPTLEKESIASGATINRRLIMHNDFLVIGPGEDPAGIGGMSDAASLQGRLKPRPHEAFPWQMYSWLQLRILPLPNQKSSNYLTGLGVTLSTHQADFSRSEQDALNSL